MKLRGRLRLGRPGPPLLRNPMDCPAAAPPLCEASGTPATGSSGAAAAEKPNGLPGCSSPPLCEASGTPATWSSWAAAAEKPNGLPGCSSPPLCEASGTPATWSSWAPLMWILSDCPAAALLSSVNLRGRLRLGSPLIRMWGPAG